MDEKLKEDNFILEDLENLLETINEQIHEVEVEAHELGISPAKLRLSNGDWALKSLLVAKAHTINAMALMKSMERFGQELIVNNYSS